MRIGYLWGKYSSLFFIGLRNALGLACLSIFSSLVLGIVVGSISYSGNKVGKKIAYFYVNLIRNTPLLVQVYFFFFGLPSVGINLSPFWTGIIALSLNSGAYISEIIKSGLQSIEKGQSEAANAIGLKPYQKFVYILIPQAMPQVVPAVAGQFVVLFQDTSLMSVVSVIEIVKTCQMVGNETYLFVDSYVIGCIIYFVVLVCLNLISDLIESFYNKGNISKRTNKCLQLN